MAIAIGWADFELVARPSRVWFSLFRSALVISDSPNSLMVVSMSSSVH